jgi:transketolase
MGMADIAEVLWNDFLKHNPTDPTWYDRDRLRVARRFGVQLAEVF